FGSAVAEMVCREHPRLIFLTDAPPGGILPRPDGYCYQYFYWDAFYKGLLLPCPRRHALLKQMDHAEDAQAMAEGRLTATSFERKERMRLDSVLYFTDLWNRVAYDWLFTLWTPQSQRPFTRPRHSFYDSDPGPPPLDKRFGGPNLATDVNIL